ncbi:hypothetical protein BDQ12DRAFT_676377 [Crucibulum laeve]|uniref:NAD-dependent epimerase/dehydratase domain-containing protein n=1 Tax=Crucibulum laeve TaxID=68775 RepID=A0A5C3MCQ7_9AGAR|nr:hypothetical protein BDQ12DRAFT_676377 [Crucibulum laeve]
MSTALKRILVVGGNGFIGSAVCKAAIARGWQVTSVSSSGQPFRTAKGHSPAWASKVDWQKGDALHPQSFAHLFPQVGGVVHTLGILIENERYKKAVQNGNVPELVGSFFQAVGLGTQGNPLRQKTEAERKGSYESLNREAALSVCNAFVSSTPAPETNNVPRPFVYISAEDIFRPVIPARYIETKREAEQGIQEIMRDKPDYRGVFIRPSLVYHAHYRPMTTPAAVLLDLSSSIHAKVPRSLPTPAGLLRSLGSVGNSSAADESPSSFASMANALVIPPIHVDHVADAICVALDSSQEVRGVVNVRRMRELIGWSDSDGGH